MSKPQYFGRYQVLDEIGRGAMGVVYRGWDPQLERPVAIKAINVELATGDTEEEISARFLREAKLAARIVHPGVVMVYDAGEEAGSLFLVMELVEGESLAAKLRRGLFPSGEQALEIAAQVAEALGAAHQAGVVHRDVKPANVLISKDGKVKVSDFGVAKAVGDATGLTRTGTTIGSPAYMSPEQVRGEDVDSRSDLFSLGVMLFEMLLRRKPFPADTIHTLLYQIVNTDPFAEARDFSGLDEKLVAFLKWCLAKDRSQRIPDAATFASTARALAKGRLSETGSTVPTVVMGATGLRQAENQGGGRSSGATRGLWGLVIGLGLLAGLGAVGYLVWRKPSPSPAEVLVGQLVPSPTPQEQQEREGPLPTSTLPLPTATPLPTPPPTPPVFSQPTPLPKVLPQPALIPTSTPTPTRPPVVATYFGRSGAAFNVSPEETLVEIEGHTLGIADNWDGKGGGKVYRFPGPGTYYVRLSLQGYKAVWVAIVATLSAEDEVADVDWEMEEL